METPTRHSIYDIGGHFWHFSSAIFKATLYPKFWWIVKELKEVFQLEEFWGQLPNRSSRPCQSVTLVRGRFGGLLSNINSKINFQLSLKFPQTQISLKKRHLQNLSPPSNVIKKFSKYSRGFLFIRSAMWLSLFSHFKIMTEISKNITKSSEKNGFRVESDLKACTIH